MYITNVEQVNVKAVQMIIIIYQIKVNVYHNVLIC